MDRFIPVSFAQLHSMILSQGTNLGDKPTLRGAKLVLDTQLSLLWLYFQGKVSSIPLANVASFDAIVPDGFLIELGFAAPAVFNPAPVTEETLSGPPALRKRGRLAATSVSVEYSDPSQPYDPNDENSALAHREAVRAASANSNRAPAAVLADDLIQQSRATAMGMKHQKTAQVQTAQQVGQTASVTGKPKVISHAQLQAQVAAERKP